jgi:hypothetical protein
MPNTTNFNWPTPADTDLVKDGAAAIRNLGNGVDTSLVDLKGGTTGQILSKASNADMDFAFITPNVGDLTEVQAGVGISVASGTGPIPVITNSSTDLITTAGDLLYGTAADTVARLGIGTASQVLAVNSGATAPEWVTPSSGGMTLISETVASSLSSLTFSSLGSYKQLVLMYAGILHSDSTTVFALRLNNDSSSIYHNMGINATGSGTANVDIGASSATHLGDSAPVSIFAFGEGAGLNANSLHGQGYFLIDNYTSASKGKTVFGSVSYYDNTASSYRVKNGTIYFGSTTAVTSIDVVRISGSGTFSNVNNSTIRLYGVS